MCLVTMLKFAAVAVAAANAQSGPINYPGYIAFPSQNIGLSGKGGANPGTDNIGCIDPTSQYGKCQREPHNTPYHTKYLFFHFFTLGLRPGPFFFFTNLRASICFNAFLLRFSSCEYNITPGKPLCN